MSRVPLLNSLTVNSIVVVILRVESPYFSFGFNVERRDMVINKRGVLY